MPYPRKTWAESALQIPTIGLCGPPMRREKESEYATMNWLCMKRPLELRLSQIPVERIGKFRSSLTCNLNPARNYWVRVLTLGLHLHRFVQCATVHVVANGYHQHRPNENTKNWISREWWKFMGWHPSTEKSDELLEPNFDDMNEEGENSTGNDNRYIARENLQFTNRCC